MLKYMFIFIIFILICILIYLFVYDNKTKEHFTEEKDIETPIDDAYIPDPLDTNKNLNSEYNIITLYKYYLEREPDVNELKKAKYISEADLKTQLLNSPEYNHMVNMQNNNATDNLEIALAKKDLFNKLNRIYKKELNKNIVKKMFLPLRDCYVYLQFNDYLFTALITNDKYGDFEKEILNSSMLTKEKLLDLFNKYFDLLELKYKANDIIKYKKFNIFDRFSNKEDGDNSDDEDNKKEQIKYYDIKTNNKDDEKYKKKEEDKEEKNNILEKQINNIKDKIFDKHEIAKKLDKNKDTNIVLRIYDPIDYNKSNKSDINYRAPICNNLGIKNDPYPIIIGTDLALNATDLDKAFNSTQVGSIMPKFEYREYDDVIIK